MRKYFFILPLVLFPLIILLFTGCPNGGPEDLPERPTIVVHTAVKDGANLKLYWDDNTDGGSDVFFIYSGNTVIDSTFLPVKEFTIDSTKKASSVGVTAWIGDEESPEATLDLSLTVTSSLAVWSTADPDPDHPSFVKFSNGNAVTVNQNSANEADFYIDDNLHLASIYHWSNPNPNSRPLFDETSGDANLASPPGQSLYSSISDNVLAINAIYYIWIDRTPISDPPDWGTEDNFARIEVISIDGNKVTLTISYQNEDGLRWLVD